MRSKRIKDYSRYIVLMVYPWLLSSIYCIIRGTSLRGLYLPCAYNNDDLIYYKLVEGILKGGIRGYFGYNESHAMIGGFGAWSPVILLPWLVWGLIFGWNYYSPMYANMVFLGLALCACAGLGKMKWKNITAMLVLFSLFISLPIHVLNALPETGIASLMIVFFGLMMRTENGDRRLSLPAGQVVIALLLTLIRPYMIILMLYPAYLLISRKVRGRYPVTAVILAGPVVGYFLIVHYFTSPYVRPMFDTGIFVLIRLGRFRDAYLTLAANTSYRISELIRFIREAFEYGLTAGTQYTVAILMAVFSLILAFDRDNRIRRRIYLFYAICVAAVLASIILLLGYINEGGRHIWALAIVGIVLVCNGCFNYKSAMIHALTAGLLLVFLMRGALIPTDYDIPIANAYDMEANEKWVKVFDSRGVKPTDTLGYENTVIWVMNDVDENGDTVMLNYHELFAIPAGMGINCCLPDYVTDNFNELNCRYIAAPRNCGIDLKCKDKGLVLLGASEKVAFYELK